MCKTFREFLFVLFFTYIINNPNDVKFNMIIYFDRKYKQSCNYNKHIV